MAVREEGEGVEGEGEKDPEVYREVYVEVEIKLRQL